MDKIKNYVTYQPDGTLDGGYLQVPPADHIGRLIEVDDTTRLDWPFFRANAARDGLERIPPTPPEEDEVDPKQSQP